MYITQYSCIVHRCTSVKVFTGQTHIETDKRAMTVFGIFAVDTIGKNFQSLILLPRERFSPVNCKQLLRKLL